MAKKNTMPAEKETSLPEVVNLTNSRVDEVSAELVRAQRSVIGRIEAGEIELHQSGAAQISAENVMARGAIIGMAQSGSFSMDGGCVGVVRAQEVILNGQAGAVTAENATLLADAQAGILAANSVKAEKVRTVVLLAKQVEGPVETMLDTRRVVLASLAAGLAAGAVLLLGQFLFRHKD